RLAELSAFEPEGTERDERARGLIDLTRRVLLVQAALVQGATGQAATDAGASAVRNAGAEGLAPVAKRLGTPAAPPAVALRAPLATRGVSGPRDGEFALREALADRVEALQRAAEVS